MLSLFFIRLLIAFVAINEGHKCFNRRGLLMIVTSTLSHNRLLFGGQRCRTSQFFIRRTAPKGRTFGHILRVAAVRVALKNQLPTIVVGKQI